MMRKFFFYMHFPSYLSQVLRLLSITPWGILKSFSFFTFNTRGCTQVFCFLYTLHLQKCSQVSWLPYPYFEVYCFLPIYKQKKYQEWTIDVCILIKWLIISAFRVFFNCFWLCFRVHNMNTRSVAEHEHTERLLLPTMLRKRAPGE